LPVFLFLLSGCQEAGGGAGTIVGALSEGSGGETSSSNVSDGGSLSLASLSVVETWEEFGDEEYEGPAEDPNVDPVVSVESFSETDAPALAHTPEPGSLLLFGSGLLGALNRSRLRKFFRLR